MLGCLLWPFRMTWMICTWPFRALWGLLSPSARAQQGRLLDVHGESHYQENLRRVCGRPTSNGEDRWVNARLKPEPDNPHDDNAVVVLIRNRPVGYLTSVDARRWHAALPAGGAKVRAHITGGWKRAHHQGHYGVRVTLPG